MSLLTPFLKLFKWDTTNETDLESEFNIDKSMNENLDKLDAKAQEQENKILDIQDDIEKNITKNTQQDELIQKLQNNMIQESTEEATSLHLEDASDLPAVLNISGNHYQEQQERTSNLAVLNEGSVTQDGITIDIKDGVGTVSGTNTSSATIYIEIGTAYLYKDKKYYIKKVTGSGGYSLFKNGKTIWFPDTNETSFAASETGEYAIRFSVGAGSTPKTTFKLSIYEMSGQEWLQGKKAIPSLEYPSEISTVKDNIKIIQCNKNFFNVNSSNRGGVDLVLQEDGKYLINGTSTSGWSFRTGEKIWLKAGDYTLSVEVESGTNNGFFGIRGSNGFKYEIKSSELNISLTEDKEIEPYFTCASNVTFDNVVVKVQLEKSKVKTEWVKHEEKVYNLAVQQEMLQKDYFDLEREKEVHHFNKFITSSEGDWIETSDIKKRYVLFTNKVKSSLSNINQCCSHNKNCNQWAITEGSFQVRSNGLYFRNSNITNKEEFNKFVAKQEEVGTPINFYYECEKYELDLTEEQKETLNQLNNLELFKGVNNIYTEQDLALLQLNYTADTKIYIDNKIASQNKEIINVAGGN